MSTSGATKFEINGSATDNKGRDDKGCADTWEATSVMVKPNIVPWGWDRNPPTC